MQASGLEHHERGRRRVIHRENSVEVEWNHSPKETSIFASWFRIYAKPGSLRRRYRCGAAFKPPWAAAPFLTTSSPEFLVHTTKRADLVCVVMAIDPAVCRLPRCRR